jgi:outer membrane PBP1 activator LpoA protein
MRNEINPARKGGWLFLKAVITDNRVGDKAGALALYQSFLTQYPTHPLAKQATARVDALTKLLKTEQVAA